MVAARPSLPVAQGKSELMTFAATSAPGRSRAGQQLLIALVQVLALTVWFSASAVVPTLREDWGISAAAAVWLTASVQLGFVTGAVLSTLANLPDRMPPHLLLSLCALAACGSTVVFALLVEEMALAVPLRFLTGLFLAGVYPVGMKLTASWVPPRQRGRAFGILIGSLTLGSALPHLIGGIGDLPWRGVMLTAAGCCFAGSAVAVTFVRPGPLMDTAPVVPHPRYAIQMLRERAPRLANLGYFGHMWELYAWWTWLPAFLIARQSARGDDALPDLVLGGTVFAAIGVAGVAGCLVGGWASDRFGRPRAAGVALTVSGACCLISPVLFIAPWPVVGAVLLVWGASVIADSGVFSASLSETVDPRYVGSALTAQVAIGFALTVVTIQLVPIVAELVGWQYAFWLLVPGPLAGVLAMRSLGRLTATPATADRAHTGEPPPARRAGRRGRPPAP
ncbi:MFS transporter [soil metagenome]